MKCRTCPRLVSWLVEKNCARENQPRSHERICSYICSSLVPLLHMSHNPLPRDLHRARSECRSAALLLAPLSFFFTIEMIEGTCIMVKSIWQTVASRANQICFSAYVDGLLLSSARGAQPSFCAVGKSNLIRTRTYISRQTQL